MQYSKGKEQTLKQQIIFGLIWGLFMFLCMEIALKVFYKEAITFESALLGFIWWVLIAGGLYGVVSYYVLRYRSKRKQDKAG